MRMTMTLLGLGLALFSPAQGGDVQTWRQASASDFRKGRAENTVVSEGGRIRLANGVRRLGELVADHVWDLTRDREGQLYAATGNSGKVFRQDEKGSWSVIHDAADTQALALVATHDGRVFAGTGPSGEVIEITHPERLTSRPDPSVEYVWDLATDAEGNLYAATGPEGGLWKRAPGGEWTRILDSPYPHLLCVVVDDHGTIFTGSDGAGLIYAIEKDGKARVLYDSPQNEVRTLRIGPDGTLYAGTAAGSNSGANPTASVTRSSRSQDGPDIRRVVLVSRQVPAAEGGTARPKPPEPGENAVYRIGLDGSVREVFRARVLIFALAWQGDRLLVGTGPRGQIYEVRGEGRETTSLARVDSDQVLTLLPDASSSGSVIVGTGDPGSVLELAATYAGSGRLTSSVYDSELVSRFGAIDWDIDRPDKTTVAIQIRTGNVSEPDDTWSDWSVERADPATAAESPPGRFVQYRLRLATEDPSVTPEIRSVSLRYRSVNLPPEIASIEVPDLSQSDGSTRQTELTLKWNASDPNKDQLEYTLHVRKDGWPDWIRIGGEASRSEASYKWDTTSMPAGSYRLRVTASDRPSNPPDEALERSLTSEPFLVDHQAPEVDLHMEGKVLEISFKDTLTRLVRAAYSLDGADWKPLFPADGLFDQLEESARIELSDLASGTHVVMVRATDAAGNTGAKDLIITRP